MIEIPRQLRQRPKWRNFPIPFTTFIGPDGIPDFKVLDASNRVFCIRTKRCALCGEPLKKEMVFIGGPGCVENRCFTDPAMHKECALYATKACPFLANASGKYSDADVKHKDFSSVQYHEFSGSQTENNRPKSMAMFYCRGYHAVMNGNDIAIIADAAFRIDWNEMPKRE